MAKDHFKTHFHLPGEVDWNFNILFDDQPQVGEMVRKYDELISHKGLYPPIPSKWLHITLLRVGLTTQYSEKEMLDVVEKLVPILANFEMPDLILGPWWVWRGNPVLHVTPDDQLEELYDIITATIKSIVGDRIAPLPRLIPHLTLAYNRDYNQEKEVHQQLSKKWIAPVLFRANNLSLVRQEQKAPFYSWELVKSIGIGKNS